MKIAVITGASSGIGWEFVKGIDASEQLDEIWVIARRRERLEQVAQTVKTKVRPIALDLTLPESFDAYRAMLEKEKPEIHVLINNSGFGVFGPFEERDLAQQLKIIDLNDKALVAMTYLSLPYMRKGDMIYNVASSSAFQPVPYQAIYGSSKVFVFNFSRALNMELKPRGIRVMAVCPHWCKTEFFDTAVTDDTIVYYNFFNTPQEVVQTAIRNMKKGRDVSLAGFKIKLQRLEVKLLPHWLVMRVWCRQQKKPI